MVSQESEYNLILSSDKKKINKKRKKKLKKGIENVIKDVKKISHEKLPSLRNIDNESEEDDLVTIEIQSTIAEKLSSALDNKLSNLLIPNVTAEKPKCKHKAGGIKLFSNSTKCIKISKSQKQVTIKRVEIKKRKLEEDLQDIESKCRLVAVNASDILNQNDVKSWSNRSKAPVFRYKVKGNKLDLIEPSFVSLKYS